MSSISLLVEKGEGKWLLTDFQQSIHHPQEGKFKKKEKKSELPMKEVTPTHREST
jgi:hypothetical protein